MKLNLKIASGLLAAAMVTGGALGLSTLRADDTPPATSQPAAATNTKCPISGDPIDSKVTAVYDGKTYAFCCPDCVKAFNKDPGQVRRRRRSNRIKSGLPAFRLSAAGRTSRFDRLFLSTRRIHF